MQRTDGLCTDLAPAPAGTQAGQRPLAWLAAAIPLCALAGLTDLGARTASSLAGSATWQLAGMALMLAALVCAEWGAWHGIGRWERVQGASARTRLARLLVIALALAGGSAMVIRHRAEQALEMARIAIGRDPLPAVELRLEGEGRVLRLVGPLGAGSSERVRQALQVSTTVRLVRLDSPGGRVFEAQAIAAEIRRRGLDTYAEGLCASACTMLLLAGHDRGAAPQARIGFHRPQFAGLDDEQIGDSHALLAAYREAGLGAAFVARVRATRSDAMWYPSRGELQRWQVLTR
ncbi:ATP-dependent Clp protease proteolytic subunit [Ideonella sp. YS5]|uniref:ATP-dependent Clp protease proteolytic subunit n=1 Tax=Ideonella sp. YS5 TaxID=3453714 RepID=UPI003EED7CE9